MTFKHHIPFQPITENILRKINLFSHIESHLEEPEEIECTLSPECPCDDCRAENVWMDR